MKELIENIKCFIKFCFCKHETKELKFVRNIHGDEINWINSRSEWHCKRCDNYIFKKEYINTKKAKEITNKWYKLYKHIN